jgi:hypothetical protein
MLTAFPARKPPARNVLIAGLNCAIPMLKPVRCAVICGRATFESASLKKPKLRTRQDGKPSAVLLDDSLALGIPLKGPDVAGWSKRVVVSPEDESHRLLKEKSLPHPARGESNC